MNARQLQIVDGDKINRYICGECGKLFADNEMADACCVCTHCKKELPYGAPRYSPPACDPCWREANNQRDRERLERAELVESYDGPVCVDGDRYYRDADALWDECFDDEDAPEFAHCVHVSRYEIDAVQIIEGLRDGKMAEDDDDFVFAGQSQLFDAVIAFNKANEGHTYWDCDYTRKVRVRPARVDA